MTDEALEDQDITIVEDTDPTDDGRDPRKMTAAQFRALGYTIRPLLAVVREKCLDCAGGSTLEVRLCGSGNCALWPYRMGTNPLRDKRQMTDVQRRDLTERGRRLAATRRPKTETVDESTPRLKVGDLVITVKQRDAFDIIANHPARVSEIHSKTLGFMTKSKWVTVGGTPILTNEGRTIAAALGLIH